MDAGFRRGLLGLVALGALSQWLIQSQAFSGNPMVLVPQSDAAVIWDRAGEMATGGGASDEPFDTAPLMVWMTALVRSLGGGLAALGALQSLLYVATLPLVAIAARRVGGAGAGLLAGGLFLLLQDPAAMTSRVLSGTVQLFLAAALLERLSIASTAGSTAGSTALSMDVRHFGVVGLLGGLLCLAYPPMLGALPLGGAWAYFRSGKNPVTPIAFAGAAALAIAPATIHNYRATGELIPISSQAGLTFYHGNNAEADGTIAPIGVVNSKKEQATDSLERARAALGDEDAGWNDASSYWRNQGLSFWGDEPVAGVRLAMRKLWYAVSGQRYGDVYQPWRERDAGAASRLWLAPLPASWLIPLALLVLFGALRSREERARYAPLAVMVLVPIAVIVVFFYSPRYRLPSLVAIAPLAAIGLASLSTSRRTGSKSPLSGALPPLSLSAAVLLGALSGTINRAAGFDVDSTGKFQVRFLERMAKASGELNRHGDAASHLQALLALQPEDGETRGRLLDLTWFLAASRDPLVWEPAAALRVSEDLVAEFGPAPGLLDLRAAAKAALGDFAGATADVDAALGGLAPTDPARPEIEARAALFRDGQAFRYPAPTK